VDPAVHGHPGVRLGRRGHAGARPERPADRRRGRRDHAADHHETADHHQAADHDQAAEQLRQPVGATVVVLGATVVVLGATVVVLAAADVVLAGHTADQPDAVDRHAQRGLDVTVGRRFHLAFRRRLHLTVGRRLELAVGRRSVLQRRVVAHGLCVPDGVEDRLGFLVLVRFFGLVVLLRLVVRLERSGVDGGVYSSRAADLHARGLAGRRVRASAPIWHG
jgi:hypothetical protein